MNVINRLDLEQLTGMHAGVYVLILLVVVVVLIVLLVRNTRRLNDLTARYDTFMQGKNGQSLENILLERIKQVDRVADSEAENKAQIQTIMEHYDQTYQKLGVVKYNAFNEMGGKLSFSLALLNRENDGFILNAMHSREGCFTYIKEIVNGKSVIVLSEEEEEALDMALNDTYKVEE